MQTTNCFQHPLHNALYRNRMDLGMFHLYTCAASCVCRANQRLDLEDVDLPDNHPWAVKKPVSKEQDELIKARLSVRRGTALGGNAEEGPSAGGERGVEASRS